MLEDLFIRNDVDLIMRVPISLTVRKGTWIWNATENGQYSVKSGHEVAKKMQAGKRQKEKNQETSTSQQKGKVWDVTWKLKIKHKVKHFIRNCLNVVLPVNGQVHHRTGVGVPICNHCGEEV